MTTEIFGKLNPYWILTDLWLDRTISERGRLILSAAKWHVLLPANKNHFLPERGSTVDIAESSIDDVYRTKQ